MAKTLDYKTFNDVKAVAVETAYDYRKREINILDALRNLTNLNTAEGSSEAEEMLFYRAKRLIKDKYSKAFRKPLDTTYATIGARHLLLPTDKFYKDCRECGYDLFELKMVYPYVSYKTLACRIADEKKCLTKQWKDGEYISLHINEDMSRAEIGSIEEKTLNDIVKRTLESKDGKYTYSPSQWVDIKGWRLGNDDVQIIIFWYTE